MKTREDEGGRGRTREDEGHGVHVDRVRRADKRVLRRPKQCKEAGRRRGAGWEHPPAREPPQAVPHTAALRPASMQLNNGHLPVRAAFRSWPPCLLQRPPAYSLPKPADTKWPPSHHSTNNSLVNGPVHNLLMQLFTLGSSRTEVFETCFFFLIL